MRRLTKTLALCLGLLFALTADAQVGKWLKYGTIIYPNSTDLNGGVFFSGTSNADVLYDTNPQLITANPDGKVFKMWFMGGDNLYYAEANNAWGPWTRKATALLSPFGLQKIYKSGSTYYLYGTTTPTSSTNTSLGVYTATDGVTFTLQNTALSVGGTGAWDQKSVQYLKPFYFDGTTYYATYAGVSSGGTVGIGIATSTDLLHWTNPASPVISGKGGPEPVVENGEYYILTSIGGVNAPGIGVSSSSDRATWSTVTQFLGPTQVNEGSAAPTSEGMGVPSMVEANGSTYLFYTGTKQSNGTGYTLMVASTDEPISQALQGSGLVNYTVSTAQTASDTFQRANETPLSDGGAWSLPTSPYVQSNLVSHLAVATSTSNQSQMLWSGPPSIGNDQYSEVTVGTNSASSSTTISANARTASASFYRLSVGNKTSWDLSVVYSGSTVVVLQSGTIASLPIGTVLRLTVAGSQLIALINGTVVAMAADSTLTTGKPSFGVYDGTTPNNTGISLWAGGSATLTPLYPSASFPPFFGR